MRLPSSFARVRESVANYGVRAGLENAAARWARNRLSTSYDVASYYDWILTEDHPAQLRAPVAGPLRINWLLPGVDRGSGGILNIFRAIHYLEQWGHESRIYLLETSTTGETASRSVAKSYFPVKGRIEAFAGEMADSDALVATNWRSAYEIRGIANAARKFYFVQDLENLFYPSGSIAEFAKETYRWGYYGVVLGNWIAQTLQRDFGMDCSPFGFSYDRNLYFSREADRAVDAGKERKKRVLFYCRPTTERRGFELGILALTLLAQQRPDVEIVLVGFPPRNLRLHFEATQAGVLFPNQLADLYRTADVALVLSYTNISMLPLELMACRCAVVSNRGASTEWLLREETTQFSDSRPESLAAAMLALLADDALRKQKVDAAFAFSQQTNWENEIRRIEAAFYRGLGISPAISKQADEMDQRPLVAR